MSQNGYGSVSPPCPRTTPTYLTPRRYPRSGVDRVVRGRGGALLRLCDHDDERRRQCCAPTHPLKPTQHVPSQLDPIPIPFQNPVHCTQVVPKQILAWEPVKKGVALVGFKGVSEYNPESSQTSRGVSGRTPTNTSARARAHKPQKNHGVYHTGPPFPPHPGRTHRT